MEFTENDAGLARWLETLRGQKGELDAKREQWSRPEQEPRRNPPRIRIDLEYHVDSFPWACSCFPDFIGHKEQYLGSPRDAKFFVSSPQMPISTPHAAAISFGQRSPRSQAKTEWADPRLHQYYLVAQYTKIYPTTPYNCQTANPSAVSKHRKPHAEFHQR